MDSLMRIGVFPPPAVAPVTGPETGGVGGAGQDLPFAGLPPSRDGAGKNPSIRTDEAGKRDISGDEMRLAAERLSDRLAIIKNLSVHYRTHEATGRMYVDIIDDDRGDIVRSIPPEELLDHLAKLEQYLGLIFDRKA